MTFINRPTAPPTPSSDCRRWKKLTATEALTLNIGRGAKPPASLVKLISQKERTNISVKLKSHESQLVLDGGEKTTRGSLPLGGQHAQAIGSGHVATGSSCRTNGLLCERIFSETENTSQNTIQM